MAKYFVKGKIVELVDNKKLIIQGRIVHTPVTSGPPVTNAPPIIITIGF